MENPFRSDSATSTTRISMFLCVLASIAVGVMAIIWGRDLSATALVIAAFLTPAFAGKSIQSFSESKAHESKPQ